MKPFNIFKKKPIKMSTIVISPHFIKTLFIYFGTFFEVPFLYVCVIFLILRIITLVIVFFILRKLLKRNVFAFEVLFTTS
jgi:hypothetical protein